MKSGFCPKCGSNEVRHFSHVNAPISIDLHANFENYLCFNCGYSERYVLKSSIRSLKVLDERAKQEKVKHKSNHEG